MKPYSEIYAVDFDGTLHFGKYPDIGEPNKKLIEFIKQKQSEGDKAILWTCRSSKELRESVRWCKKQGLFFDAVNKNVKENIAFFKNDSRKVYAHYYVDDRNLNIDEIKG